ncbi:hypothetical protein H8A95_39250 [Bradyrhizobium sp. Pear76]|uniref:hypothetical protein n=1 Tax=Bradyrhizobium oropedii TaxID=1571201 RepID=UPI001E2F76D6|nr:hypothetical protein [Bradyrhizobium oropedii]MCC8968185.1 hypothetical protein [Bradyrhizobium oropedii]
MTMAELIKDAFAVLKEWPLVQGAVAILVLVIASLLAFSAVKRQPHQAEKPAAPAPTPVPVQIESPWLVQHLVEMHLDIENVRKTLDEINARLNTNAAAVAGIVTLLRRRAARKAKKDGTID